MAKTATTKQIANAWKDFSEALEDASTYIPLYHKLIDKDYSKAYDEITKSAQKIDAAINSIKSEGNRLVAKIKAYPAVSEKTSIIKKFKVIIIPTKLTKLSRFLDFWEGSASSLYEKTIAFRNDLATKAQDLERSNIGNAYDNVIANSNSQAKKIIDTMAASLSSGGTLADLESNLASSGIAERALAPIVTLLQTARNTEERLYDFNTSEVQKKVDAQSEFDKAINSITSGEYLKQGQSQQAATRSIIEQYSKATGLTTLNLTTGSSSSRKIIATIDFSNLEKSSKNISNTLNTDDFDLRSSSGKTVLDEGKSAGIFATSTEREQLTLKRSERETRSNAQYVKSLLESVRVITKTQDGKESIQTVFSDSEKQIISELFFTGFVRLPKFSGIENKVFNPLDGADGQTVSLVRLRMTELISSMIVNKLKEYEEDAEFVYDAVDYLRGSKQVSVKGRQGFAPGQQRMTMSEAATELLYGIARDAFPTDHTTVIAARQQAKVVLPTNEGGNNIVALNHKSYYASPNLTLTSMSDKQGDHVKGYNNLGTTTSRNLIALPSLVNNVKQDAITARDQLLLAVQVQNETFGAVNNEDRWIRDALKITGMSEIQDSAQDLTRQAEDAFSKYKDEDGSYKGLSEEIDDYKKEVAIYKRLESQAKSELDQIKTWLTSTLSLYESVQNEYEDLASSVSDFEKQVKSEYGLSGSSSVRQIDVAKTKATQAIAIMKDKMNFLEKDLIEDFLNKQEEPAISNEERQATIRPFLVAMKDNVAKGFSGPGFKIKSSIKDSDSVGTYTTNKDTFTILFSPTFNLQKSKRPNLRTTQKINSKTVIKRFTYLPKTPANTTEINGVEIEFDMKAIESIIKSNRDQMRKLYNKQSSINKLIEGLKDSYANIKDTTDELSGDLVAVDKDRIRYTEKLRGYLTAIVQDQTKQIEEIRTKSLDDIQTKISDIGLQMFSSVFQDLKRGEQSWRQARSLETVKTIIDKAKNSTGYDFIDENIKEYQNLISELNSQGGAIDKFMKLLGKTGYKTPEKKDISDLQLFSNTLIDLIEANKFVIFSEYFE